MDDSARARGRGKNKKDAPHDGPGLLPRYDRVMNGQKKRRINWDKIRDDYVTGERSYRALAEKYKINVRRIQERGVAEGWVALREQFRAEVGAQMREDVKRRGAGVLDDIADITAEAICRVRELLGEAHSGTQTAALVEALKMCKDLIRDIYGIPTLTEAHRQQIDKDRLDIERDKLAAATDKRPSSGMVIEIEGDDDLSG